VILHGAHAVRTPRGRRVSCCGKVGGNLTLEQGEIIIPPKINSAQYSRNWVRSLRPKSRQDRITAKADRSRWVGCARVMGPSTSKHLSPPVLASGPRRAPRRRTRWRCRTEEVATIAAVERPDTRTMVTTCTTSSTWLAVGQGI
jgi:hypothetical protein